jgi:hypothetical protein
MLQRFIDSQIPPFARSTHPVMRYMLLRSQRRNRLSARLRWGRPIFNVVMVILLIVLGYQVATNFGLRPLDQTVSPIDQIFLVLYWPLVLVQLTARTFALLSTTNILSIESAKGTWETLKLTTNGANLTLRTRWAAVFYQLRFFLLIMVGARILFVIVALVDFTNYNGRYIDLLITGTVPLGRDSTTLGFTRIATGILCVALQMTAALIAPFTAIAFDAALGTLLGVLIRSRLTGILGQVMILSARIVVTVLALVLGALALSLVPSQPPEYISLLGSFRGWWSVFFGVTEGDLGLTLLHLPNAQRMYVDIDYGIFIGVAALLYFLFLAAAANVLLSLAVRQANRAART